MFYNYWKQFPFFRLLLPFMAGIILSVHGFRCQSVSNVILIFLFVVFILLTLYAKTLIQYKNRNLPGIVATLFLLIFGFNYTSLRSKAIFSPLIDSASKISHVYTFLIDEQPEIKANSVKFTAKILQIKSQGEWYDVGVRANVYTEKTSYSQYLKYGDVIIVKTQVQPTEEPRNPGEFNYKHFLFYSGIGYQCYIKKENIKIVTQGKGNPLIAYSLSVRDRLMDNLKINGIDGQEYAVAIALLLGYKENIDADMVHAYSGSGAMHILCVSGLHVGTIFLLISFLLKFMGKTPKGKVIRLIIILLTIWFYALLTGLSPSVMRASTMFSFVAAGQAFKRPIHVLNTLSSSAFILLLINPLMLMSVGFQLSYLAVTGIVLIQRSLYNLWIPENIVLDKVWAIVTVSIAAQLATAPLSLYYFHQFPNYFILTNIIVIPLSTIVIYSGVAAMLFSGIPLLGQGLAWLLSKLVWLMNTIISYIESLPYATTYNIAFDLTDTLVVVLFIVFFSTWIVQKKIVFAKLAYVLGCMIFILISVKNIVSEKQNQVFLYQIKNHFAMEFVRGRESVLLVDDVLYRNQSKIHYHLSGNRLDLRINKRHIINFDSVREWKNEKLAFYKYSDYVLFDTLSFNIADGKEVPKKHQQKFRTNYVLVKTPKAKTLESLIEEFQPERLILLQSSFKHKNSFLQRKLETLPVKAFFLDRAMVLRN